MNHMPTVQLNHQQRFQIYINMGYFQDSRKLRLKLVIISCVFAFFEGSPLPRSSLQKNVMKREQAKEFFGMMFHLYSAVRSCVNGEVMSKKTGADFNLLSVESGHQEECVVMMF